MPLTDTTQTLALLQTTQDTLSTFTFWVKLVSGVVSAGFLGFVAIVFWSGGLWEKFKNIEHASNKSQKHLLGVEKGISILVTAISKNLEPTILETVLTHVKEPIMASGNPITQEEADKINAYVKTYFQNLPFEKQQALEFFQLASKYNEDKRNDPKYIETASQIMTLAAHVYGKYGKGN